MVPGWYPDPYGNGTLRWWDGASWTAHTAPMWRAPDRAPRDAAADLVTERAAGRRAGVGLLVGAALVAGYLVVVAAVFGHAFHQALHGLDENINDGGTRPVSFGELGWDALALPTLAVQILLMIWLYRAALVARHAGVPAAREPYWAWLGFIVPIVNFWFPYQVARDLSVPGDPARGTAGRWWAWSLAQNVVAFPVLIVALFSVTAGVVLAVICAVIPIMAAREGRALIAAVTESHTRLLTR